MYHQMIILQSFIDIWFNLWVIAVFLKMHHLTSDSCKVQQGDEFGGSNTAVCAPKLWCKAWEPEQAVYFAFFKNLRLRTKALM